MSTDTQDSNSTGAPNGHLVIHPEEHDLGGFVVRRALPSPVRRMVGPWIFFDHMGPASFAPGQGIDVRPHPHINLATVTYLFDGQMLHRDSLGNEMTIKPGAINLMVAGRGIVHSERQPEAVKGGEHRLEGLQLWHALPADQEEIEPAFHHYAEDVLPEVDVGGVSVRVLIGTAYGVTSPVRIFAPTLYLVAALDEDQRLMLPGDAQERAVYVVSGAVTAAGLSLPERTMGVLPSGQTVELRAEKTSRIAVVGGSPVGHRHIWWNFVSSRRERIEQAKRDWREGVFPKVPNDDQEFIPLPED